MRDEIAVPLDSRVTARELRAGVRVEIFTIVWMVLEAAVAITAGVLAHSVLLMAFGFDSVIELISGATLLWRLSAEARTTDLSRVEAAERRAAWISGIALLILCGYILASSCYSLVITEHAGESLAGIVLALSAVVVMPLLAWRKRVIAARIDSHALLSDAACSTTCAYLAVALLIGLVANATLHWWWADTAAALVFLIWLIPETKEALGNARRGRAACDGCT